MSSEFSSVFLLSSATFSGFSSPTEFVVPPSPDVVSSFDSSLLSSSASSVSSICFASSLNSLRVSPSSLGLSDLLLSPLP